MRPIFAAGISLAVGVVVLGLKYLAYRLTGSVSLYSDALESTVNVAAAVLALFVVRLSGRPPDERHPYGHTKAEYFSAVVEGALILFAAVEIVRSAWARLAEPPPLVGLPAGVSVSVLAGLLNGGLGFFLLWVARRERSPALAADGRHVLTDVVTTAGVLMGIGLASLTGWWILDPVVALAVAANILWVGVGLVRDSIGGLMDETLPQMEMAVIQGVIDRNMEGALEAHALRSRRAAHRPFIEFHLVVPGTMSVSDSPLICDRLEDAHREALPGSNVTIHVEPEGKAKHDGRVTRLR